MLTHARPQPPIGTWLEISSAYYKNIQEVLIGGATPQVAMAAADKAIDAILKK
jgi:multiple sugar transport system substrate-binding protein